MNMLDSALSLKEIEQTIGEAIVTHKGKIRTIGDLQLSSEDYKILELRFRGFRKYQNEINIYEQFSLSLLAYGTYLFMNESNVQAVADKIYDIASNIPQYLQRKILDEFDITIKENSLSNPSIHLKTVSQLISVFLCHSYSTEDIYMKYFNELEAYSGGNYTSEVFAEVDKKVFPREFIIYEEATRKHALGMQDAAFLDCIRNGLDEEQMARKYIRLPYMFIKSCCKWCECHEKQANLKVVK